MIVHAFTKDNGTVLYVLVPEGTGFRVQPISTTGDRYLLGGSFYTNKTEEELVATWSQPHLTYDNRHTTDNNGTH